MRCKLRITNYGLQGFAAVSFDRKRGGHRPNTADVWGLRDNRCERGGDLDTSSSTTAGVGWLDDGGCSLLDGDGTTRGRREGYIKTLGEDLRCCATAHLALRSHGRYLGCDGSVCHGVDNSGRAYLETYVSGGLDAGIRAILAAETFGNLYQILLGTRSDGMDDMGRYHNKVKS